MFFSLQIISRVRNTMQEYISPGYHMLIRYAVDAKGIIITGMMMRMKVS